MNLPAGVTINDLPKSSVLGDTAGYRKLSLTAQAAYWYMHDKTEKYYFDYQCMIKVEDNIFLYQDKECIFDFIKELVKYLLSIDQPNDSHLLNVILRGMDIIFSEEIDEEQEKNLKINIDILLKQLGPKVLRGFHQLHQDLELERGINGLNF